MPLYQIVNSIFRASVVNYQKGGGLHLYAFSNSLLELAGEYRVEIYNMEIFGYDAGINIELKVFGEGVLETYIADLEITRNDGKIANVAIMNQPTKEDTFVAVEEMVIRILNDENSYWE